MGSPLRLTLSGIDDATGASAWNATSALFEELEEALSRFRPSSELTALNCRAGDRPSAPVGRWLARALAAADRAGRLTDGAFDPRILADLERLGYAGASLPPGARAGGPISDGAVSRPAFADGRWLRLDPRTGAAAVAAPVDLGGIGKGLALRWAMHLLARRLPGLGTDAGALLEAGGDLVAAGPAPQGGPWLVGIEDPGGQHDRAVIAVSGGAVATSSVRVHAWRRPDGTSAHHLVDPRTGAPGGAGLMSVTVADLDPAWAEVRSKTLFLEGARRIGPRARALGLAAWWIRADGVLEMTPAARVRTTWEAGRDG
jgi:thiamine biosynthesis lipoprotein